MEHIIKGQKRMKIAFHSCRFILMMMMLLGLATKTRAINYYINASNGSDGNEGISKSKPWRSATPVTGMVLQPGDSILFANGQRFEGTLSLENVKGASGNLVHIGCYQADGSKERPLLDAGNELSVIRIRNASFIEVSGLEITAVTPYPDTTATTKPRMRCGVLVEVTDDNSSEHIILKDLLVHDVYLMPKGFKRTATETQSANGTQGYGWGIRFFNESAKAKMSDIQVLRTEIYNVSHTGLKLTAVTNGIRQVNIAFCKIHDTGGPGLQMSGVTDGMVHDDQIARSGSVADSRNWGRGSGMWTWDCHNIIIEHNRFEYANGPGDSNGVHIDYNCSDVVVQYNLSANNAGGFCEILGNNRNCAYRYNISINDGYRVKGKNGAFQEGKIFWLSGFQGNQKVKAGPYNSYFYNNTIYVSKEIVPKISISSTADGVLIANNIFYLENDAITVAGDQKKNEVDTTSASNVFFKNNLFLRPDNWPASLSIQDASPLFGDPHFLKNGGRDITDYIPANGELTSQKGMHIEPLPGDAIGLRIGLQPKKDIIGDPINGKPGIGAINWRATK